jgi:TonB family protein
LPTPKPSPNASATPKAKATPKPAPKPTAKKTVAKAKPLPKPKRKADEKEELASKIEKPAPENKKIVLAKNEIVEKKPAEKSAATQTGSGKGATAGTGGGRAGGSVNEAEFGWYGSMLHDRFYSEWAQPASLANSGGKNSVLVKLRIEKDGRVSSFEIVRSSGNEELDNSVKALAGRVSQVDPLPDGLGRGDHYDVKINFELNSE